MKAMILAAGVGSRLRPLTDRLPKALVEVGGVPMLELVAKRLLAAGATELIVNVFHLADQVESFIAARGGFGVRVEVSREEALLDTGGGLKKASWFFDDGRPFLVHNVDVISEIDLAALLKDHAKSRALATLAVHTRPSKRALMFDEDGRLRGRAAPGTATAPGASAFAGVHAVSPALFAKLPETGPFSITDAYVRLAAADEAIRGFDCGDTYWTDIGDAAKLEAARQHAAKNGKASAS